MDSPPPSQTPPPAYTPPAPPNGFERFVRSFVPAGSASSAGVRHHTIRGTYHVCVPHVPSTVESHAARSGALNTPPAQGARVSPTCARHDAALLVSTLAPHPSPLTPPRSATPRASRRIRSQAAPRGAQAACALHVRYTCHRSTPQVTLQAAPRGVPPCRAPTTIRGSCERRCRAQPRAAARQRQWTRAAGTGRSLAFSTSMASSICRWRPDPLRSGSCTPFLSPAVPERGCLAVHTIDPGCLRRPHE